MTKAEAMDMGVEELVTKFRISQHVTLEGDKEVARVYHDAVVVRNLNGFSREEMAGIIKARKPECIAYFEAQREAERKAREERQAKIDAIPGLQEIKDASAEMGKWHAEFERSFDEDRGAGVGGLGVGPCPGHDIKAMREQYPIADAYLKAEHESNRSNYEISAIGKRALEAIIENPEDYEKAIAQMETELHEFTNRHIWD